MKFSLRLATLFVAVSAAFSPHAHAQQVFTFDTHYQAQDLSLWSTGPGTTFSFDAAMRASWYEQSGTIGGFSTGLFGDEWGASASAKVSGSAGFNVHFAANGGTFDLNLANKIKLTVPVDNATNSADINITQLRPTTGNVIDSTFATFEFSAGAHYDVNASVSGRIAYGIGSASGTVSLTDIYRATAIATMNPSAALLYNGTTPFNVNLNNLFSYNLGGNNQVNVMGQNINIENGITKTFSTEDVVKPFGYSLPTVSDLGSITFNPNQSLMNMTSGNSLSASASNDGIIEARINLLGAAFAAAGWPLNPFDLQVKIPETPIEVQATILKITAGLKLGLSQSLTLIPNTYLNLQSNHDVTYTWTDSNGDLQTLTTSNLKYRLPDDAAASTLKIASIPDFADFQLYSSVYISPQLRSLLQLTLTGDIDFEALAVQIGAYGVNVGFGPLLDETLSFRALTINLFDQTFDLSDTALSKIYRNPIPLFGAGVIRGLPSDGDFTLSSAGSYAATHLSGHVTVADTYFNNTVALNVSGTFALHGRGTLAEMPTLTLSPGATLNIDADSNLTLTSATTPGFLTQSGSSGDGIIESGNFLLGGTLNYQSIYDINIIGANASVDLMYADPDYDSNLGHKFNNYLGQALIADGVDGLRYLHTVDGALTLSGQNLVTLGTSFTNNGTLIVKNGNVLSAALATFKNTGTVTVGSGSALFFNALHASNLTGGVLSNFNLTLGDTTGAGAFYYFGGGKPTALANTTSLTLSGARANSVASNGYLQTGADTDALTSVTANAGTLLLKNGATQTLGGTNGGLTNTGTLTISGSGSKVTVNGALGNTGTLTLASGGALAASGNLTNLSSGLLGDGGVWNLNGVLDYAGTDISGIAFGTTVVQSGAGNGFRNGGGNAFDNFSTLNGSLALLNGASLTSTSTLTFGNGSSFTLGAGSALTVGGLANLGDSFDLTNATLTTGSLPMSNGQLVFPELILNGTLNYNSATNITGISTGTYVTVRSGGNLRQNGGNGWANLASVSGNLSLENTLVRTDAALTFTNPSTLTLNSGGRLQVTGASLDFAPNSTFNQAGGKLILGGGATQTVFNLNNNFALTNAAIDLGSVVNNGSYFTTTGSGQLLAAPGVAWSNSNIITGAGAITGGTFTNTGFVVAGGGTLTLSGFEAPVVNRGILTSTGVAGRAATLALDNVALQNYEGTAQGLLAINSLGTITGGSVTGGRITVGNDATLETSHATLRPTTMEVNGTWLVRNGSDTANATTTAHGDFTINSSGNLTLQGGATPAILNFETGSSLINYGNINFGTLTSLNNIVVQNSGRVNLGANVTTSLVGISNTASGSIEMFNGSTLSLTDSNFINGGLIHLSGENPNAQPNSRSAFKLTADLALSGGGTLQLGGYNTTTAATAKDGSTITIVDTLWNNAGSGNVYADTSGSSDPDIRLTLAGQHLIGRGFFGLNPTTEQAEQISANFFTSYTLAQQQAIIPGYTGFGTFSVNNLAGSSVGVFGTGSSLYIVTNSAGFLNQGRLDVGPGATMILTGGPFRSLTNGNLTEGTYRVGGTLVIDGLDATSPFNNGVNLVFEGANSRITGNNGVNLTIKNNLSTGSLTLIDTAKTFATTSTNTFTNSGALVIGKGATATFTGGYFTNLANDTLSNAADDTTGTTSFDVAGTLKIANANIVTNATDLTLRAIPVALNASTPEVFTQITGKIQDANGQNALQNFAVNTGRFTLRDYASFTVGAGVGNFTQRGTLRVEAGSTFDFGNAGVTNVAADTPDYFIAGTIKSVAPIATDGTHLTFFGAAAKSFVNGIETPQTLIGTGGTLTFAGGYRGLYTNHTVTNNGLWEIGSATAPAFDGATIRSGGYVTFGTATDTTTVNGPGTLRLYSGETDDDTQLSGLFVNSLPRAVYVNRLTMNGGTLDLDGALLFGASGVFNLNGLLTSHVGGGTLTSTETTGTLNLTGGLDLSKNIAVGANFNYTYAAGYAVDLDNVQLQLTSFTGGANGDNHADISLANHSTIQRANGASLLVFNRNYGDITLVNNPLTMGVLSNYGAMSLADSVITLTGYYGLGTSSYPSSLRNHGTLAGTGTSAVIGAVTNFGTLSGVTITTPATFFNSGTVTNTNILSAALGDNVVNFENGFNEFIGDTNMVYPGGTFNGGRIEINGDLISRGGSVSFDGGHALRINNSGTMAINGAFVITAPTDDVFAITNGGTLTVGGDSLGRTGAPIGIVNFGTLNSWGSIPRLVGDGDLHIVDPNGLAGATTLSSENGSFGGNLFIDQGKLLVSSDLSLGSASAATNQAIRVSADAELVFLNPIALSARRQVEIIGSTLRSVSNNMATPVYIPGGLRIGGTAHLIGVFDTASLGSNAGASLLLGDSTESSTGQYSALTTHGATSIGGMLLGRGDLTVDGPTAFASIAGGSTLVGSLRLHNGATFSTGGTQFTTNVETSGGSVSLFGSGPLVFSGLISGTSPVQVSTQAIFTGNNTYTGLTTINTGASLTIGDGGTSGNLGGSVTNYGTFTIDRSDVFTLGSNTSIYTGALIQNGSGRTIALNSSALNGLTINHGTFQVGDSTTDLNGDFYSSLVNNSVLALNGIGTGRVTTNGTGRIDVLGSANLTFNLSGGSGVSHYGSGEVTLASNSGITDGRFSVGTSTNYSGSDYRTFLPGGGISSVPGGGTLIVQGASSFGTAPTTFTADFLTLGLGSTLRVDNPITFTATQGVVIGGDTTIRTIGNLTLPTVSGGFTLTKSGYGTLELGAAGYSLNATQGATIIRTALNGLMPSLDVSQDAEVRFTNGGSIYAAAASGGVNGHVIVDAGTSLTFTGVLNAPTNIPVDVRNGTITVAGNLNTFTGSTLHRVAGTGTFTTSGTTGTTTTVHTLDVGTVNLNGGILSVANYDADVTNITANNVVLSVTDGRTGAFNFSYDPTINVSSSFSINGALTPFAALFTKNGAGNLVINNAGTVQPNFVVNDGILFGSGNTTFAGVISGAGGFGVSGLSSHVTVTNTNTFTGGTTIAGGELVIGNGGTSGSVLGNIHLSELFGLNGGVMYNRSGDFTLPNTITGAGYFGQQGAGTLIINSAVNGTAPDAELFTGQMRISTGTIRLDDGATGFGVPHALTNSTVALSNNGTLALNNTNALSVGSDITGQGTVRQTGSGTSTLSGENNFDALAITAGKTVLTHANTVANTTVSSGATLALADGTNVGNVQRNGTLTGAIANSGTISLERLGDYANAFTTTGSGIVVQNGTGTAYVNGATQSNRLAVNSGHLATLVANNETTSLNGQLTLAADTSFIKYGGGTLVLNAGASGAGFLDASSGTTRLAGGAFTSDIHVGATLEIAQDMGFANTISGSNGTVSLVDSELALVGHLNVGTTRIDATSKLGLNNGSSLTGSVVNNGLISFDYSFGNDTTFASTVSGTGAFEQNGAGKVTLTGASTATGGATIAANRTLAIAGTGSINGPVTNHGTLSLADSGSINGAVTNNGTFAVITTAGSRSNLGNITGSGTLAFSGAGTVGVGSLASAATLSDGVTLLAGGSGTSTFSQFVSGTGNLSVEGTGTLIVTGDTLLNGDVTLTLGTLQIGNGGATGSVSANRFFNNGTLVYNLGSGTPATLGSVSGNGAIRQSGAGTLSIVNDNPNFTGTTTVDATRTLWIGNGSAGSVGGALVVNGTLNYNRTGVLVDPLVPSSGYVFTLANSLTGAATGRFELLSSEHLTLTGGANFLGEIITGGTLTVNGNLNYSLDRFSARSLVNHSLLTLTGDSSGRLLNSSVTNDGTLTFSNSGWLGNVSIANSGTVAINRSDDVSFGNGANIGGNGIISQNGTGHTSIYSSVFADRLEANAGTLEFYNGVAKSGGGAAQIRIAATGTARLNAGSYANNITNDGTLQTAGSVEFTSTGNTYNGALHVASGSLTLNVNEAQALNGALTGSGDLRSYGNGALQLANAGTFTGAISTRGSSISSAGDLLSNVTFEYGGLLEFTNAGNTTFSGTLAASYAGFASALRYTGLGSFTLDSAYAGATEITRGQLLLGTNGFLGGALTLGNYVGASFALSGKNTTLSSLSGGGVLGGTILLGANTLTLSEGTFGGAISGSGGLTKNGFGHLTLSGANTFTGGIVFNTGTLTLGAGSAGSAPASARADYLTLGGSTLNLLNGFTLAANQGVTLAGDVLLNTTGFVALNSDITGTGNLTLSSHNTTLFGGRVLNTGTLIVGNDSTIAIGRADSIDVSKTIFRNRTTLDIRGIDWSQNLNFTQGQIVGNVDGTVANSAATPVTLSSQITATNGLGLSGTGARLTFTGSIVSSVSPTDPLALYTNGEVALGTATAASLQNITVQSGALYAPVSEMTNLSTLKVESGGGLHLMGTPGTELTLSTLELKGNNSGLYNSTGDAVTFKTDMLLTSMDSGFRDTALIGGDYDLTFNGSISGQLSLLKVGSGNLFLSGKNESNQSAVTGWSNANNGARLGVREGTLTTNLALLENRGLIIENSGQLVLTDAGNAALTLRTLDGNGTLNLGVRGLNVNLVNTGTFTGTLTTSGLVIHNAANGLTGGPSGGTQTYGTVNTLGLEVNVGNVIVTDALNTDYVTVNASGAAGSLTTTTRGLALTSNAATLDATLQIQGTMRLSDGAAIRGNAGFINLTGIAATLTDGSTTSSTLSHLTSNSGQIYVSQGALVTGGAAATFTNTGVVSIGGANGATVSRWDGFNNVTNSGNFSWSGYQLTGANQTNARFTSTGGRVEMLNAASFTITSGSALNNPAFTLTNTAFTTSGAASITGGLALTGGTFTLGGAGTIGTLNVAGGVVFGGGTNFLWDINHAVGTDGVNRDLLAVTAMAGQTDGKITFSGSAANPITFRANNPTGTALINFNDAQPIEWVVATTTEGFSGFSADQFIIDVSKLFTSYTGNFGLAVNGNNLVLKIFQSHVFDAASGNTVVSTPLAAMGDFGGLSKSGAGTLTLATANNYTGVTTLNAGTLVLAADGALGTNRLTLNGGTLESSAARTVANGLNLSASSTIGGAANLTFTGSLISTSGSKTLAVTNTGTTTFGAIDFASLLVNERLTFNTTGGTVNVAGTIVGSSASNTGITKTGTGTLVLSNTNTYSGVTTVSAGTLVLATDGALGTSTLSLGAATTLRSDGTARTIANNVSLAGDATLGGTGNLTLTGPLTLTASRTLTVSNTGLTTLGSIGSTTANPAGAQLTIAGAGNLVVTGAVANSSAGRATSLAKNGTGTLTLNGVNTYSGNTTVNAGSLVVNGSSLASAFTVNSGATIGGSGSIGTLTLASGATLAPGNSPGTLTTGSEIWNGGANYNWQIQNATGAAGTGYDLVSISGSLTINATSASRFNLNLFSILAGDTAGSAINFNSAINSSYTIASATGGIFGFDANAFTINSTGFTNATNGGSWNLAQVGNNVSLNFAAAAIPEPSTYAALFGALVLAVVAYRKRPRRV